LSMKPKLLRIRSIPKYQAASIVDYFASIRLSCISRLLRMLAQNGCVAMAHEFETSWPPNAYPGLLEELHHHSGTKQRRRASELRSCGALLFGEACSRDVSHQKKFAQPLMRQSRPGEK
jgi:hypothetical protein